VQLGKFFGELNGASMLMKQLIGEDTSRVPKTAPSKYVFRRLAFVPFLLLNAK
jgi:hypothetical protein